MDGFAIDGLQAILIVIVSLASGFLGWIGGEGENSWVGFDTRWIRVFLLPILLGSICYPDFGLIRSLTFTILLTIAFSLPYGEKHSWLVRIGTFTSYSLDTLALGLIWE